MTKAELSRGELSQDSDGVSVAFQCRFLELAAVATNDPLLGLHVAAETDLRGFGVLFYLGASSATVAEALELLARYSGTADEADRFEIARHKDETVLTNRPALAFDDPRRQVSEFDALAIIKALRTVTNRDFAPSRVTFAPHEEL